jgi:hypothetical protein
MKVQYVGLWDGIHEVIYSEVCRDVFMEAVLRSLTMSYLANHKD